jgi:dTDP-4-dehydrorhamnose reductase
VGIKKLLSEAWGRYRLPIAVTEAHLSCTSEEQMRWFKYIWDAACHIKSGGADIRAVTAWCLLGAYDWNSLLTRNEKVYETGVFDTRNNRLEPTATAKLIKALATTGNFEHPLLLRKGWWQQQEELTVDIGTNNRMTAAIF